jgi:hypothetical protein
MSWNWLDNSNVSNKWNQSYFQGFVDISGSRLEMRNGNIISMSGQILVGMETPPLNSGGLVDISGASDGSHNLILRTGIHSSTPNFISAQTYDGSSQLLFTTSVAQNKFSNLTLSGDSVITFTDNNGINGANSNMGLVITPNSNGTNGLRMKPNSFIGINVNPSYTLDVFGTSHFYSQSTGSNVIQTSLPPDIWISNAISNTGQYQIVCSKSKVWYSVDYGASWTNPNNTNIPFTQPANKYCAISDNGTMYVSAGTQLYYATTAMNGNFSLLKDLLDTITCISINSNGNIIFVGGYSNAYLSTNGLSNGIPNTLLIFAIVFNNGAGSQHSPAINTNGVSFIALSRNANTTPVYPSIGANQYLLLTDTSGYYSWASSNFGQSWRNLSTSPNSLTENLGSCSISSTGKYQVVVGYTIYVYISCDYGNTFAPSPTTFGPNTSCALYSGNIIYVSMFNGLNGGGCVYDASNAGLFNNSNDFTFNVEQSLSSFNGASFLTLSSDEKYLLIAVQNGNVYILKYGINSTALLVNGSIGVGNIPATDALIDLNGPYDGKNNLVLRSGIKSNTPNYISTKTSDNANILLMATSVGQGSFSYLTQPNDSIISYGDSTIVGDDISMGLVIAPIRSNLSTGGIRIDASGRVAIGEPFVTNNGTALSNIFEVSGNANILGTLSVGQFSIASTHFENIRIGHGNDNYNLSNTNFVMNVSGGIIINGDPLGNSGRQNLVIQSILNSPTPNTISVQSYDGSAQLLMTTSILSTNNIYSPLLVTGDSLISYGDSLVGSPNFTDLSMGLVIAPKNPTGMGGIRMDASGNMGIGTRANSVNGGPKYILDISGYTNIRNSLDISNQLYLRGDADVSGLITTHTLRVGSNASATSPNIMDISGSVLIHGSANMVLNTPYRSAAPNYIAMLDNNTNNNLLLSTSVATGNTYSNLIQPGDSLITFSDSGIGNTDSTSGLVITPTNTTGSFYGGMRMDANGNVAIGKPIAKNGYIVDISGGVILSGVSNGNNLVLETGVDSSTPNYFAIQTPGFSNPINNNTNRLLMSTSVNSSLRWNQLIQTGDSIIIFEKNLINTGIDRNTGLVISPFLDSTGPTPIGGMRIDSSGNIGIGTTANSLGGNSLADVAKYILDVSGSISIRQHLDMSGYSANFTLYTPTDTSLCNYIAVRSNDGSNCLVFTTSVDISNNYSKLIKTGDSLITYGDCSLNANAFNRSGSLVIAPKNPNLNKGIRMDASGNVGINKTPSYAFDVSGTSEITTLTTFGSSWKQSTTSPPGFFNWVGCAISSDGNYKIAISQNTSDAIFENSGNGWFATVTSSSLSYSGCGISTNGTTKIVTINGGGILQNNGGGWNTNLPTYTTGSTNIYTACAISGSGQYKVAVGDDGTNGYIVYNDTINDNTSWNNSLNSPVSNFIFTACAISTDGNYHLAVGNNTISGSGKVYRRSIGGTNIWSPITQNSLPNNPPLTYRWTSCAVSGTGKYMIIVSLYDNYIFVSNNFGNSVTWTPVSAPQKDWRSCSVSYSGQYMMAGTSRNEIYLSTDYGNTWNLSSIIIATGADYISCAMDAAGEKRIAVDNGGYIYETFDNYGSIGFGTYPNSLIDISGGSDGTNNFILRSGKNSATPNYISLKTYDNLASLRMLTSAASNIYNTLVQNGDSAISYGDKLGPFGANLSMGLVISPYNTSPPLGVFYGMRMDQSGNVGIGKSPVIDASLSTLDVSGNIRASGYVSGIAFQSTSDYRVKENVLELDDSFGVDLLRPVSYYNHLSNKVDVGFIAHEVQEQYPFMVIGEKDGESYQSLNYTAMIPILVKEMKDLKEETRTLKTEIKELMEQIQTQNTSIDSLKKANHALMNEIKRVRKMIPNPVVH